jgi:hypothetical protein
MAEIVRQGFALLPEATPALLAAQVALAAFAVVGLAPWLALAVVRSRR